MRLVICVVLGWAVGAAAKKPCTSGFEDATGVLFDEDGRPVEHGSIELFPLDDFDSFTNPVEGTDKGDHYAKVERDGTWSCRCLRKGAYEVQVQSGVFAPVLVRGITGTPTRIAVRIRGAVALGRVVAAVGIAAKDVHASVTSQTEEAPSVLRWPPRARNVKLAPDFSFKTPPLIDGPWLFSAYDSRGRTVEVPFEVRDQKAPRLEVSFKLAAISGIVLGKGGAPVADAGVSATAESVSEDIARSGCGTVIGRGGFRANTDKDGRFVIAGLSATAKYRLEAQGLEGESEPLKNVPTDPAPVKLVTDQPRGEFGVLIVSATGGTRPRIELRRPREFPDSQTQEEGAVRFEYVRPGPLAIDVFAAGKAARSVEAIVEPGEERAIDPIALVDERPLRVSVRDGDTGQPVEGARILLEERLWQRAQVALDEYKGSLSGYPPFPSATSVSDLHGLSLGPVAFFVYAKGYAVARFMAAPAQSEIDVRLKPHAPVAVTVVSRDGGVLLAPTAFVEADTSGPTLHALRGRAVLPRVDPGVHVLLQSPESSLQVFPSWFSSGPDGGQVAAYEAVGGATLRVKAFSTNQGALDFRLVAGDYAVPRVRHPFWVLERAAIRPSWRGQSGAQFQNVRPGTYTVMISEPERRLGQTLRYHQWRRVLELKEGLVPIELESCERLPDLVVEWPPPDAISPNPFD